MSDDSWLVQFDSLPGFRLVDYRRVGLPVYVAQVDVLSEERRPLPLISEYCLRMVAAGVQKYSEVRDLLGLGDEIVKIALADLFRAGAVTGSEGALILGPSGREILGDMGQICCNEETWFVPFDGILRRPFGWRRDQLLTPKQLGELGHSVEIFPFGEKPSPQELPANEVWEVVSRMRQDKASSRLVSVRRVRRAPLRFVAALMLAYRGHGQDIHIAFLVDRRPLEGHDLAFSRAGGLKRPSVKSLLSPDLAAAQRRASTHKRLRGTGKQSGSTAAVAGAKLSLKRDASTTEAVRVPPVYMMNEMLNDALVGAKERLLLSSRALSRSVIDSGFRESLASLVAKGVSVIIGVDGSTLQIPGAAAPFQQCLESLCSIATKSEKFQVAIVESLPVTHLIVDDRRLVVGEYDWLAAEGGASRNIRERWFFESSEADVVAREFESIKWARNLQAVGMTNADSQD